MSERNNEMPLKDDYSFKRLSQPEEKSWDDVIKRFIGELIKRGCKTPKKDLEWLLLNYYALPNSPALLTAGTELFSASACSSYPVYDTLSDHKFSILNSLGIASRALKAGIGVGFNFSQLRSKEETVRGIKGVTEGPVGFLKSYDGFIDNVNQLKRKAACMGLLEVNHPDIRDFILCKAQDQKIQNFNISVVIDDEFMKCVESDSKYLLRFRNSDETVEVQARELFDLMCQRMWDNGEPGVMFSDTIQRDYFDQSKKMNILANPCSEALLSWDEDWLELCVLATINFPKYQQLSDKNRKRVVDITTRMLNDIIDVQDYICEEHRKGMKEMNRKVGIGIAGFATEIAKRGLKYSSQEACEIAKSAFKEIGEWAEESSSQIGDLKHYKGLNRYNASLLSQAPTSSLAKIYDRINEEGCSFGIEPYFSMEEVMIKNSYGEFKIKEKIIDFLDGKIGHIECANDLTYKEHLGPMISYYNSSKQGICQGASKCVDIETSYIQTCQGLLKIDEMVDKMPGIKSFGSLSSDFKVLNSDLKIANVGQVYNNGKEECLRVNLQDGSSISGTKKHKLYVLTKDGEKWIEISKLKAGDMIIGKVGENLFNDSCSNISDICGDFKYANLTNSKKAVLIPERTSSNLARFLGYLCSDGGFNVNGIFLSQRISNSEIIEDFKYLCKDLFNLETKTEIDTRSKDLCSITSNSRKVVAFIRHLGVKHHNKIVVPEIIRRGTKEEVLNFLRGLTLDGHVSHQLKKNKKDKKAFIGMMTSISREFLSQIQTMLKNLGIRSSLRTVHKGGRVQICGVECNSQVAYGLIINKNKDVESFKNVIGFLEKHKQKKLNNYKIGESDEMIPFDIFDGYFSEIIDYVKKDLRRCRSQIRRKNLQTLRDNISKIPKILYDDTYEFNRVESVDSLGVRATADIAVPQGNSYLLNGVFSHNTINFKNNVTVDDVKEALMYCWKNKVKAVSFYRDGSRKNQQISTQKTYAERPELLVYRDAPKRPNILPCSINHLQADKQKWIVFVGLYNGKPYEVFCGLEEKLKIPKKYKNGSIVKADGKYNLVIGEGDDELLIADIPGMFENKQHASLTRLISMTLRHGTPLKYCVEQLLKDGGLDAVNKALARVLKNYVEDNEDARMICPNCSKKLVYISGCPTCTSCQFSKCG